MISDRDERNKRLIQAIITECGGRVEKQKLLMLIYLFDIEWYREHRETYTGWTWYNGEPPNPDQNCEAVP